jgi:hypothetical protein
MKTEFEANFVSVDLGLLRRRLKKIGATQTQEMTNMRRVTIDSPYMKQKKHLPARARRG